MIVAAKDGVIKTIKIGNLVPEKGEVSYPYDWGTDEILCFLKHNFSKNKFEIDENNPDTPFDLLELK